MNLTRGPADAIAIDLNTSNIAGRLERLPMTAYQRKIFAIIASAWLVDQVDVALLTFLLGSIVVAFDLTQTQAGQLAAMTFAGQLVGNILAASRYRPVQASYSFSKSLWLCGAWQSSRQQQRGAWPPLSFADFLSG